MLKEKMSAIIYCKIVVIIYCCNPISCEPGFSFCSLCVCVCVFGGYIPKECLTKGKSENKIKFHISHHNSKKFIPIFEILTKCICKMWETYDDFYFCIPIFVFGQLKTITHTWVNVKLKVECHLHHEQQ